MGAVIGASPRLPPQVTQRSRLAACTSECLLHAGGGAAEQAAALAAAQQAAELATSAASPAVLAAAHCQLARCHWAQRDGQEAEAAYRQALELSLQSPPCLHLPAVLGLSELLAQTGRAAEAAPLLQQAQAQLGGVAAAGAAAEEGAPRQGGDLAGWLELVLLRQAGVLCTLGDLEGAKAVALAADGAAAGRGQPMQVCVCARLLLMPLPYLNKKCAILL